MNPHRSMKGIYQWLTGNQQGVSKGKRKNDKGEKGKHFFLKNTENSLYLRAAQLTHSFAHFDLAEELIYDLKFYFRGCCSCMQ